jgi:hypothetical protein
MATNTRPILPIHTVVTRPDYQLVMYVVDELTCASTDHCPHCVLEDSRVQANIWLPLGDGTHAFEESCLPCLIPVLDSGPWIDRTQPITVEVAHGATQRPF